MISIDLPKEIEQQLALLAQQKGQTTNRFAQEVLLNFLEDLEDYNAAVDAYAEFRASDEQVVSSEELKVRLGLDD
jgi:predicted DNA-binding protein